MRCASQQTVPDGFSKKPSDEIEESSDEIEELYRLQNEIDPLAWQGKYHNMKYELNPTNQGVGVTDSDVRACVEERQLAQKRNRVHLFNT